MFPSPREGEGVSRLGIKMNYFFFIQVDHQSGDMAEPPDINLHGGNLALPRGSASIETVAFITACFRHAKGGQEGAVAEAHRSD